MYDELIKRLRDAAKMSEALAVLLPHSEGNETAKLYREAADAIEELATNYDAATYIEELQEDNAALNGTVSNLIQRRGGRDMKCVYARYHDDRPPCCTHECDGCLWCDEDEESEEEEDE